MITSTLSIQVTPDALFIRLSRKGDVDGFHSFTTAILCFGLLVISAFIYKSVVTDGVVAIQVLFILVGTYGLFSVNRQLRRLWLFHAGHDIVEVKEGLFTYSPTFGIWRRRLRMRVADIQGVELVENPFPSIAAVGGGRPETRTRVIRVWRSNKTQCFLGQFLGAEERTELYDTLRIRLDPIIQVVE
ncbi:MAG: hypothetical protein R2811_01685 [Flavobacteriales bacterium]